MQSVQALEIELTAVHHKEGARLRQRLVEHVDVVQLPVGDVDEGGDVAAQVDQRVQLDGRLGRTKRCPRKQRQAHIDRGGIQDVDRSFASASNDCSAIHRSSREPVSRGSSKKSASTGCSPAPTIEVGSATRREASRTTRTTMALPPRSPTSRSCRCWCRAKSCRRGGRQQRRHQREPAATRPPILRGPRSQAYASCLPSAKAASTQVLRVQSHVDTGMGRLGCQYQRCPSRKTTGRVG